MKILYRFMLKQFVGPFIMIFTIVAFILLMQFLWKYIDELVGKGLDLIIIGEFLLYATAHLASMAFPLAVLVASIFTLGNLGENYELIALKSAGISLRRIVAPLVILSCIIAGGAFVFANNVAPVANLKMRTLLDGIRNQRPELQLREGVFSNMIDGYSIRIGRKDYNTNQLYDLRIYDHTENIGNVTVILADSGNMAMTPDRRFLEVMLYSGQRYQEMVDRRTLKNSDHPFSRQFFERQIFRIALPDFGFERSDEQMFKKGYQMMNLEQLNYTIDSLSDIILEKKKQVLGIVKPAYEKHLAATVVDTTQRSKIPDDFMTMFAGQTKAKRLDITQSAVNEASNRKDQIAGVAYEEELYSKQTWRYDVEWHRKFTMSIACVILFFIGAPLGAIIRKGGLGTPIIIAVIFFVFYYVISMIGEKAAKGGSMTPLWGMWLSTAIVSPVSVFLTYKATRDSSIFNPDIYLSYIRKAVGFVFALHHKPRPDAVIQISAEALQTGNILFCMEDLTHSCKRYLENNIRKPLRSREIFSKNIAEKAQLMEIGEKYDTLKALLHLSDIDIIRETVAEYPYVSLNFYKIQLNKWYWAAMILSGYFPMRVLFYFKTWIQRDNLRRELEQIIGANENLTNELQSVL
ncbi:MAG: LptF/LptG family permease [Bacteroidales bacterium]|nr:LptF/LptG family permease [Bacteroidales bacterium]